MATVTDEFDFIDEIRRRAGSSEHVPIGIGDDAALIHAAADTGMLVATDLLAEGVHFDATRTNPVQVGRKALAVNLSDIAAMAGRPTCAFVSLLLPRGRGSEFATDVMAGIHQLAAQFSVVVAGGDTNCWNGPPVINVAVIGEPTGGRAVCRSGATVGDWILVTGQLGGSLTGRHLTFQPRVAEAIRLHQSVGLHAMIDVSDGLSADLHHILEESGVGASIIETAIPISADAIAMADQDGAEPLQHALGDGEDFELLFTVSEADGRQLLARPPFELSLAHIGSIETEIGLRMQRANGAIESLPPRGWSHQID